MRKRLPAATLSKAIETKVGDCSMNMNLNLVKKKPAVLYHYPCPDGAFAALAAHLYFSSSSSTPALFFPNTVYNPISSHDLPLHEIDDLYLLDFVGPPGFVQQVSPKVSRVLILDHHKTALEASIEGENVSKIIDMGRSGATIAYDYFRDKVLDDDELRKQFERVRLLFDYIEDVDLWRWRFENSKAFSSGLKDLNIEFSFQLNPSVFQQLLSLDLESVISQGTLSLSHKQRLIEETLTQSYKISLGGGGFGYCLAVDADTVAELRSELGHQLATKSLDLNLRICHTFSLAGRSDVHIKDASIALHRLILGIGAVVYRVPELRSDQLVKISLRSVDSEDTTCISQEFGGGGHRNASSFMLSSSEFERWKMI